jgi:D-alanyl-D-alanine carboxypeptidase/D-alanyl-D-alanine-endopeptidase (penicillin-binding protein 4)
MAKGQFFIMKRLLSIVLILMLSSFGLAAKHRRVHSATQRLAKQSEAEGLLAQSVWGFCAVTMDGDTLVWLNPEKRLVPASNMKLITTGAALLNLGGDFIYKTGFATDGLVRDSILIGNLYLIGGGDPLIGEIFPYLPKPESIFQKWEQVLKDKGIKGIQGDIIGDGSFFSGELSHSDWSTEDLHTRDGVVPSGLSWRGKMGDSIPDGPYPAALHYLEWLNSDNSSISVSGTALEGHADSLTFLGEIPSEPLHELVGTANRQSDNFISETLIKTLGKHHFGADDYKSSTRALRRSLSPLGLMAESGKMRFADGSGLSRKNYISPSFMVGFLNAMARSRVYSDFLNSLPYAGEKNTTLQNRLSKAPSELRLRVRMKSGSMNGVNCFSGYILPGDGKPSKTIVFSLLTNNSVASNSTVCTLLDEMIISLARENE